MCPVPALPLQPGLLSLGWRSLCCAATNDDACTLLSSSGDRRKRGLLAEQMKSSNLPKRLQRGTLVRETGREEDTIAEQHREACTPMEPYFDCTPQPFGAGLPDPLVCDVPPRALPQLARSTSRPSVSSTGEK